VVERRSQKDAALFYVTLKGEFNLTCVEDGSGITVGPFYGEAMDSGDKATNKAMSAAFKYMAMEVFCIPTEGDNDADATTHTVAPAKIGMSATDVAKEALADMEPAEQEYLKGESMTIMGLPDGPAMVEYIGKQKYDTEEKLALWALLPSNVRSAIKKNTKVTPAELAAQP
jgi:hypothetical protein